jgi:hypothetical protein
MSKGWHVKVETNVVFIVDTNIGVVAPTKEQAAKQAYERIDRLLDSDDWKVKLEKVLPWELDMGGLNWNRGSMSGDIEFDTMQCVSITPDSDFDPEPDEDQGPSTEVRDLMEAAQCLNEAFHNLPEDHPLKNWMEDRGIAEVRDQINLCAIYCDRLHCLIMDEQGYDGCFDFDFCPQFLNNCVGPETFMPKSEDLHVLSMYWSGIGA